MLYRCLPKVCDIVYQFARAVITKHHKLVAWTTGVYHLTVLEAGSLRSRCVCRVGSLEAVRKHLFQACLLAFRGLLANFDTPWFVESPWLLPSRHSPCVGDCLHIFLFYNDTSHIGWSFPLRRYDPNLTWLITSATTLSPKSHILRYFRWKISTYKF